MKIKFNEVTWYSKILAIIIFVGVFFLGFKLGQESSKIKNLQDVPLLETKKETSRNLCFSYKILNKNTNLMDEYNLKMNLTGDKVTGELNFLPTEKDTKTGKFKGTVTPVNKKSMSRTIDAFWDTKAEGMEVTEELMIIFGEGTANIGSGEMKDRGDGVYIYENKNNIDYTKGLTLTDVTCEQS